MSDSFAGAFSLPTDNLELTTDRLGGYDWVMQVTVRFFSVLRDRARTDALELSLNDGATVASAIEAVGERLPDIRPLLVRAAFAVNRNYVKPDAPLADGDELALIPPVSGG